jgi:hypothetical protein
MTATVTDFLVKKGELQTTRFEDKPAAALNAGEARLKVEEFAFTANNITYAVFGDMMKYWNFYPAPEGWGRIPVWGYATVAESKAAGVSVGDRVFGYLPMSTSFVIQAGKIGPKSVSDLSPWRAEMSPVYSRYAFTKADANYDPKREGEFSLLSVLFQTGWLIADYLQDNGFAGAKRVAVASASSKTALCLGHALKQMSPDIEAIGLTSPGNLAFTDKTRCYDRVVTYADIPALSNGPASVFVDMAGDARVRLSAHKTLGDGLKTSVMVGATHWSAAPANAEPLPGPQPQFFFAPTQIEKRYGDWGPDGYQKKLTEAWGAFLQSTDKWLKVRHSQGRDGLMKVYEQVLNNKANPEDGHIVRW